MQAIAQVLLRASISHVIIAARGTSHSAAIFGRYLLEYLVSWPVSLAAPSLYTVYERPPRMQNALVIGISQSGQAADVAEVVAEARRQNAVTVAITNTSNSRLAGTLARLIRFETIRNRLTMDPLASLSDLAYDLGYTDQAHLIHDFGAFADRTPGEFATSVAQRPYAEFLQYT